MKRTMKKWMTIVLLTSCVSISAEEGGGPDQETMEQFIQRVEKNAQKRGKQLDKETTKFINDTKNVRYDRREKKLYLSSIFNWYEEDFLRWVKRKNPDDVPQITDYLIPFLNAGTAQFIKNDLNSLSIEYIPYDWGLNDMTQK